MLSLLLSFKNVLEAVWISPGPVQRGFLGASSEWSWQSKSPSHSHELSMRQRPLAQRNSVGPHVGYSAGAAEETVEAK